MTEVSRFLRKTFFIEYILIRVTVSGESERERDHFEVHTVSALKGSTAHSSLRAYIKTLRFDHYFKNKKCLLPRGFSIFCSIKNIISLKIET